MSIPKERVERFAVNCVKETLTEPSTVKGIEHHLRLLYNNEPERRQRAIENLERSLEENSLKRRNLIEALEVRKVGSNPQTILERLEELERENRELENKLTILIAERSVDSRCADTAHSVANFILNFDEQFDRSDPFRKKSLLRQCISGILVDRERKVVRLAVRRIPVVTAEIESVLQKNEKNKAVTGVMTAVRSGGGT